jgi:hypothetical protein
MPWRYAVALIPALKSIFSQISLVFVYLWRYWLSVRYSSTSYDILADFIGVCVFVEILTVSALMRVYWGQGAQLEQALARFENLSMLDCPRLIDTWTAAPEMSIRSWWNFNVHAVVKAVWCLQHAGLGAKSGNQKARLLEIKQSGEDANIKAPLAPQFLAADGQSVNVPQAWGNMLRSQQQNMQ